MVLALSACTWTTQRSGQSASTTTVRATTESTVAPGTVPPGPPLCDRLPESVASKALGFGVKEVSGATSISCVYTSPDPAHRGSVLSLTSSDAGEKLDQLLSAARSVATSFTALHGLGDAAYVAVIGGQPQAALIFGGRQYSISLSASPPLEAGVARRALIGLLQAINTRLR